MLRNLSIGLRLFMIVGGIIIALITFQAIYYPAQQIQGLVEALEGKGTSLAGVVTRDLSAAIEFNDQKGVEALLQSLAKDTDFMFAALFDGRGGVVHSLGMDADVAAVALTTLEEQEGSHWGDAVQSLTEFEVGSGVTYRLLLGLSSKAVAKQSVDIRLTGLLVGSILLAIGSLLAYWLSSRMGGRLERIAQATERAAAGDLTTVIDARGSNDEIGRLASSLTGLIESQRRLVASLSRTAQSVSAAAHDVISYAQEQEQGVREQTSTVEEVSESMGSLSGAAEAMSEHANRQLMVSEEIAAHAARGQDAIERTGTSILHIVEKNEVISELITGLHGKSSEIVSVVAIIDNISNRLDLLALNAALEGSRVGDAGKGFSMVAHEMRRLAENVNASTTQIKATIDEIRRFIANSLEASEEGSTASRNGAGQVNNMAMHVVSIFESTERATEAAQQITRSTQQQKSSSDQMVAAIAEVANVSVEALNSARSVTVSAEDLTRRAAELNSAIERFQIESES